MSAARLRAHALLVPALLLLGPVLSTAAAAEEAPPPPSWTLTLLAMVNFALYAYLMYRFAWPPIVKYLKERRTTVVEALEAAARAHAEAEALKAEFEEKLRHVEADAARARDELMEIARTEAEHLLEQARRSADRIHRDAQLVADQEVARARRLLQEDASRMIAQVAGEIVAHQLTPRDQAHFVETFLSDTRAADAASGEKLSEVGS